MVQTLVTLLENEGKVLEKERIIQILDETLGTAITGAPVPEGEERAIGPFLRDVNNPDLVVYNLFRRIAFARKMHGNGLEAAVLIRQILAERPNLTRYFYTPAVAEDADRLDGIARFQDGERKDLLPEYSLPLKITLDDIFNGNSHEAVRNIRKKIRNYVQARCEFYGMPILNDSEWRRLARRLKIVISDGERMLGDKDQGAEGREICHGKLLLYYASMGFDPRELLPVVVDIGTNNMPKHKDRWYQGLREIRITGDLYDYAMHIVGRAIAGLHPAMLQLEDFTTPPATRTLRQWRAMKQLKGVPIFDDDIEGTAALVVGGLLSAHKQGIVDLKKSYYLFHGAGAGSGLAEQTLNMLKAKGLEEHDALARIIMTDSAGLLYQGRNVKIREGRRIEYEPYLDKFVLKGNRRNELVAWMQENVEGWHEGDKIEMVYAAQFFGTNILLGLSGNNTQFTPEVLKAIRLSINGRIDAGEDRERTMLAFGMSNPHSKCEFVYLTETELESEFQDLWSEFCSANSGRKQQILQEAAQIKIGRLSNPKDKDAFLKSRLQGIIDAAIADKRRDNIFFATGSPFPSFEYKNKMYKVTTANNQFLFPGLGAIADLTGCQIDDEIFYATSEGIAASVEEGQGEIYPRVEDFQKVSMNVTLFGVKKELSRQSKLRRNERIFRRYEKELDSPGADEKIMGAIQRLMWWNSPEAQDIIVKNAYRLSMLEYGFNFNPVQLCELAGQIDEARGGQREGRTEIPAWEERQIRNQQVLRQYEGLGRRLRYFQRKHLPPLYR
ncbi:hypothetical protein JW930_06945 [Candidatus Woesearchaeota archaeon]|nr:hypothetical protein [Candidatus Woesearchaeota archaeon]